MSIDIVITTYRNCDKLKLCLSSIIEKTKRVDYHIYLLANDPNEEVNNVIYDSMYIDDILFTDRIEVTSKEKNDGSFASNNNEASLLGSGDYIMFLNDDTIPVNDNWLYNMQTILDTDTNAGIVGSLLLYPDKKIQHCGVFFSHKTNNLPYHMCYRQPYDSVKPFISVPRYYQAVTGACMLLRRKDFEDVGRFCEDYFYQYEDIDLCLKMKSMLKKNCVYCPDSILIHDEGISKDGKNNPKFSENINLFKNIWSGKYFNDLEFYQNNPNHMIYKYKG
ncbi:MAG: glycosyltransferase family 2 protein [Patescibacteria group bacterium]